MLGKPVGTLNALKRRELGFSFVPEDRLGRGAVQQLSLSNNGLLTGYGKGLVQKGIIQPFNDAICQ
jgi:simple sugar transport system ATP-binding protein